MAARAILSAARAHGLHTISRAQAVLSKTPAGKYPLLVGAGATLTVGGAGLQLAFGSADHFYDHRFTTSANPNDLAEFYGNEDFMEIFCVFPFMVDFMMRSGHFDDAGHVYTFGLPGSMEVSMMFEEYEEDTTGDGEKDTVTCFNKQERFHDTLFGFPVWDMVQNFGFKSNGDGTTTVYHYGERIRAPFPIRIIFQLHALYVIWAVEQHVNSELFGTEEDEDAEIAQRHNIPFHVMGEFLGSLTEDVEAQLGAVRAKQTEAAENNEEVTELREQLAELEATLAKLKAAQLKRGDTTAISRVTKARARRPTLLARNTKTVGADDDEDAELEEAVRRTATRAKLVLKLEDEETQAVIKTAVEQLAGSDAGGLQRRLTSLYANPDVHSAAFAAEGAAADDAAAVDDTEPVPKAEPALQSKSASTDAFTAELATRKAEALEQMQSLEQRAAQAEAATPATFAAQMVRRATMIRRSTLSVAADLANQGHRVEVLKNKFAEDGSKTEEVKLTFHPKLTRKADTLVQ